ncbi:hypothetical protein [Microbacterium sp. 5K110]|uniref:hypothetical protein n=1 Tax=Microbacterium sp. 5K110 TaxID=2578104 RepID=UPI0010FD9194|nr:hypothetical protein [Microbacterium sp. 5K110]TLF33244.1 hypothetical protein FE256_03885 [Microbacterium sp. 5K110]
MSTTPLERLDDAIHTYLTETVEMPTTHPLIALCAWPSRVETAETDDVLPLVTGAQYALGPQTSTTDASGIVQFLSVVLERAHWHMLNDGDADDDA